MPLSEQDLAPGFVARQLQQGKNLEEIIQAEVFTTVTISQDEYKRFLKMEIAAKELLQALNKKEAVLTGFKNGDAGISEVHTSYREAYKAYTQLFELLKPQPRKNQ